MSGRPWPGEAQLGRSGGADGAELGPALQRALVRDFVLAT